MSQVEEVFGDLMIDIETLDTKASSVVTDVAAVFYDRKTGGIGSTFLYHIDIGSQVLHMRTVNENVIRWRKENLPEIGASSSSVISYDHFLELFYKEITDYCPINKVIPWGNGSGFDISILDDMFAGKELKAPWKFYNVRDVRTIVDIGKKCLGIDFKDEPATHDPVEDCMRQIKRVVRVFQELEDIS